MIDSGLQSDDVLFRSADRFACRILEVISAAERKHRLPGSLVLSPDVKIGKSAMNKWLEEERLTPIEACSPGKII